MQTNTSIWRKKPLRELLAQADGNSLKRTLGPWSLVALGIGAIIGAGLFISIFALYLKFDAIIHQSLNKLLQKFIRFISIMKYKSNAKD